MTIALYWSICWLLSLAMMAKLYGIIKIGDVALCTLCAPVTFVGHAMILMIFWAEDNIKNITLWCRGSE